MFSYPLMTFAQMKVSSQMVDGYFKLADQHTVVDIIYDESDEILVRRSAEFLADDIEKVTGRKPILYTNHDKEGGQLVIVGSVESTFIQDLVEAEKIDIAEIEGQWERYIIQTVLNPFPDVDEALVIVGSDKRGAAYGVFTLSKWIGVSPWYWWADAPVQQKNAIFLSGNRYLSDPPSVKYRGIFINDEAPALRNWAEEKFGGFNHQFYEKVFELILRNRGNYLWPAMWRPAVFATDDPENLRLADEYGIVISSTHHEPMMRYHEEWSRYNGGAWNYETNKEKLNAFWKEGIERMGDYESVVTLGMRGDGDEAMTEETVVDLMKNIIDEQRNIIEEVTGKPASETPQVWALYKEVQDYYDKGMRVDDDILILFCDDNWGNVRILPKKEDLTHSGGYGMYYHFDFVGGPVSYRWINVTQIERVYEQMNLAYDWGVQDLWIVNVGDIKPMELPISFFLDFAWDAERFTEKDIPDYYKNWASQQFGEKEARGIGKLISRYTKYSARHTPEMLKPDTYSLINYREADRILEEYQALLTESEEIFTRIPESHKSAYYQLVHFPILISANLNEMYVAAGKNHLFGDQSRASTNYYADRVREKFDSDAQLISAYHDLAGGKWNHMMSQTHIGYTSWNNPPVNRMPAVSYIQIPTSPGLGYVVEHGVSSRWRRGGLYSQSFSGFDPINKQEYFLEIFNRGTTPLNYTLSASDEWIRLSSESGSVTYEEKVFVSIDWGRAPAQNDTGAIILQGAGQEYTIEVPIQNFTGQVSGFVENNGVVSIEADHFDRSQGSDQVSWVVIPNMGRTGSSVTVHPPNADPAVPGEGAPLLEFDFTLLSSASLEVQTYLSPTLNYKKNEGLKFAIAIDDHNPQIINMHEGDEKPDWEYPDWWNNSVTDHIRKRISQHGIVNAGVHTLKVWMVDPGIVFQKFVIDAGGLKDSYLGPPESTRIGFK